MNTLKTAVVVVILLGVLYGVYRVLNMPDPQMLTDDLLTQAETIVPEIDIGLPFDGGSDSEAVGEASSGEHLSTNVTPVTPSTGYPTNQAPIPPPLDNQGSATRPPPSNVAGTSVPPGGSTYEPDSSGVGSQFDDPRTRDAPPADATPPLPDTTAKSDPPSGDLALVGFEKAWQKSKMMIDDGRFREALAELSVYYDLPGMTDQQREQLLNWLDPLAGKVIYSTEHRLESPYVVRRGDRLEDVATRHDVPWQLLYNINREVVKDPQQLYPGDELKVVRGPFRAYVDLEKSKLTIFLRELYAGHFAITIGNDPAPRPGVYFVRRKLNGREYYTRSGQTVPASDPQNPYGRWFIDLGSEVSIHSSPESPGDAVSNGCISLSPIDAGDVFAILSEGSQIEIR